MWRQPEADRPLDDNLNLMTYFVYILVSLKTGESYTGYTSKNPKDRLEEHNKGTDPWTQANGPFKLKYFESFVCKEDARKRELFFKSGVGKKLKKIILEHF